MRKFKDLEGILLIDDEDITNFLHQSLIKKLNIDVKVDIAKNGQMALDYLNSEGQFTENPPPHPGLILLDINMPVMNGWEFLERYEQIPENRKAKIVLAMVSSSINPDDINRAKDLSDVNSYIKKPLTKETLEEFIIQNFEEE